MKICWFRSQRAPIGFSGQPRAPAAAALGGIFQSGFWASAASLWLRLCSRCSSSRLASRGTSRSCFASFWRSLYRPSCRWHQLYDFRNRKKQAARRPETAQRKPCQSRQALETIMAPRRSARIKLVPGMLQYVLALMQLKMLLFRSEVKQCQKQYQSESKYSTNVRHVKHVYCQLMVKPLSVSSGTLRC